MTSGTDVCCCAVQPYQPSLSAAWLFQRSMALKVGQLRAPRGRRGEPSGFLPPSHINRLLQANFRVMQARGTRAACCARASLLFNFTMGKRVFL